MTETSRWSSVPFTMFFHQAKRCVELVTPRFNTMLLNLTVPGSFFALDGSAPSRTSIMSADAMGRVTWATYVWDALDLDSQFRCITAHQGRLRSSHCTLLPA